MPVFDSAEDTVFAVRRMREAGAAVIVVLVLTAFIVWAILSGASTFGT